MAEQQEPCLWVWEGSQGVEEGGCCLDSSLRVLVAKRGSPYSSPKQSELSTPADKTDRESPEVGAACRASDDDFGLGRLKAEPSRSGARSKSCEGLGSAPAGASQDDIVQEGEAEVKGGGSSGFRESWLQGKRKEHGSQRVSLRSKTA